MKTDLTVAGYAVNNNKILLIKHKKLRLWLPPGGHIERHETPTQAVKREFKEETNLEVKLLNTLQIPKSDKIVKQLAIPFYCNIHSVGDHNHYCQYYLCELLSKNIRINKKEILDMGWFNEQALSCFNEVLPSTVNIGILALNKYQELLK